MTVTTRALRYVNYSLTGLLLIAALATLFLWLQALLAWGDAMAFASALTWTVVTVALSVVIMGVEHLQNGGE